MDSLGASYKWNFLPVWCIFPETGRKGQFDFMVKRMDLTGSYSGAVVWELDGGQHFSTWPRECIRPWQEERERDLFKMSCALKNGYNIVRVLSHTVLREEASAWMPKLKKAISVGLNSAPGIWLAEGDKYDEMAQDIAQDPYLASITLHRY